jgi:beta-glucosidase
MAEATMYFPPDFLWGTATSSHQVEGNNTNNDWWRWEEGEGHILDGSKSGRACDWWENAEADFDRAEEMGANAHRLSIEWSRVEPEPGLFDQEALDRYKEMLQGLHDRGMEPMVTLHHFSNPLWLVEKGDFSTDLVVDYFRRYTAKVAAELGDLIPKWVTINEPMVYVLLRSIRDAFPAPKEKGWSASFQAIRNMLRSHAAAYHTIKESYPEALVGVAKHFRPIKPRLKGNRLDSWWAKRVSHFFNASWMDSMATGRLRWPIGRGSIKELAGTFDFVGINYYSQAHVRFPPRMNRLYEEQGPTGQAMVGDSLFGHHPADLFDIIKENLRHDKPLYITECGIPDASDELRPAFIMTHLREVWRAISFNFPVMGFYHWSLIDNFEWERGWTQRFGLIELDPQSQERRWRPSGRLYGEICRSNSISSAMADRYAPELLETMFPGRTPQKIEKQSS